MFAARKKAAWRGKHLVAYNYGRCRYYWYIEADENT
jgi:hypothetical protein